MSRIIRAIVFFIFAPIASVWAADGATEIDVSTAISLYDKKVVFIDARNERSYKWKGHIAGAINLTQGSANFTEANLLKVVTKDQPVVFYCNCFDGTCRFSALAANDAVDMGYREVYYYMEGIDAWTDAGYPVEYPE
jgi:rhodanese-related sulfurtransferase